MIAYAQKHSFGHQNHVSRMPRSWVGISLLEVLLDLLQPLHPVCSLQVYLRLLKIVPNDSQYPKTCSEAEIEFHSLKWFLNSYSPSTLFWSDSTSWSPPWPPTSPPHSSWPSGQSESSENSLKWFPMPQNIGFATRTMFLACSEAEIDFHSLKCFLTSYSPFTLFMAFRSIWGFLKLVPNDSSCPKH